MRICQKTDSECVAVVIILRHTDDEFQDERVKSSNVTKSFRPWPEVEMFVYRTKCDGNRQ